MTKAARYEAAMRAYLDAFSGISGDMTVGALLDLGVPFEELRAAVGTLGLQDLSLGCEEREHDGVRAIKFLVTTRETAEERSFAVIRGILERGGLAAPVRERALAAFRALADAEGRIHGVPPDQVHFHEVGGADAIADVVGAAFGVEALGITSLYVSALPLGRGVVDSRHGRLPVPAPATADLLRGFVVTPADGEGEMVTPTGAAILRGFGAISAPPPPMRAVAVGYGAGTRHLADRPNVLRIVLGEDLGAPRGLTADEMLVTECTIDDMSPELYEHVMARLFAAGAVDVTLTPVQMKKSRPGVMLQVIAAPELHEAVAAVLFAETTTIGLRSHPVHRLKLARRIEEVATPYGAIAIKIAGGDGAPLVVSPEYESCRAAAERHGVALRMVYEAARHAFHHG